MSAAGKRLRLRGPGRTLFGRLLVLVVLVVLLTQGFTLWFASEERARLLTEQLYGEVLDTLASLEGSLEGLTPTQRLIFLETYNRPGSSQLLPMEADIGQNFDPEVPQLGVALAQRLSNALGEPVAIRSLQQGVRRELWIQAHVLGDEYWLVVPLGRYAYRLTGPLLLAAVFAAIVASAIALVFAWYTTRPLSRMAVAARSLEQGRTPVAVPESGPREVRQLAARFNRMTEALEHSASERRLMLAGLSHDLRTPLTRIKLMLEMQEDNADRDDMLDDIDELSRIVRQFIDFARSEEPRPLEPVALSGLVESVASRFARDGLDVRPMLSDDVEVMGDALGLERLLSNLLENARRYGQPPVEVLLVRDGKEVLLAVTDHGTGIPPELREAALAPFERLAAHRGTDGGSGLGLAIVKRIVDQHHGRLVFSDPRDGGFRIEVRLPILARA